MSLHCPVCGEHYAAIVRCIPLAPAPNCDAPSSEHLHLIWSRCNTEQLELPEASELAALACPN